jgi:hypothetical protein
VRSAASTTGMLRLPESVKAVLFSRTVCRNTGISIRSRRSMLCRCAAMGPGPAYWIIV